MKQSTDLYSCGFNESIGTLPERMLLIGYFDPRGISTVPEILSAIQHLSAFKVTCLNLFDHRFDSGFLKLNPEVDLSGFDIIVVHNSVAYNPANLTSLDSLTNLKFSDFKGVKVLFKQDENFRFKETSDAIACMKFDIVLTCLPSEEVEKIYPPSVVGQDVKFAQMLTGYITPSLRTRFGNTTLERPVDIGYRGSIQPLNFGRLCYEKRQIGDEVSRRLMKSDLNLDISSRWEDRFGGEAWFDFLSRSKCILGVESGASIFDLHGDLEKRVEKIVGAIGSISEDPMYCELFLKSLEDLEGNIKYNQLSPRHFEAAACGALQIMYPGEYSGIFIAERHYLSLSRDFSNLSEVIKQAFDPEVRKKIIQCAYEEIVMNQEFWIETFVRRLDDLILQSFEKRGRKREKITFTDRVCHHGLLLAPHRAHLDPRLKWIVEGAPDEISISLMGLQLGGTAGKSPLSEMKEYLGDMPLLEADSSWLTLIARAVGSDPAGAAAFRELFELERSLRLSKIELCERYGASTSSKRLDDFRWYMQYILNVTNSLTSPALSLRGLQFVIAADLPALLSALILKAVFGIKVLYDAHEYWAENDSRSEPFEILFWQEMERRLVPHADICQVVSPGLAGILCKETGSKFNSIPNCTPLGSVFSPARNDLNANIENGNVRFLFQGLLTHGRGLEELLRAWKDVPSNAQLFLRGPDSDFKSSLIRLVTELKISDNSVVFLPAVSEDELVKEAKLFDVGIVPYPPSNVNNINCCPNKLSQYMAAGLAILGNDTAYVKEIVTKSESGVIVDFGRTHLLAEKITWLSTHEAERKSMATKASTFFRESFNWDVVSKDMYQNLHELLSDKPFDVMSTSSSLASGLYLKRTESSGATDIKAGDDERFYFPNTQYEAVVNKGMQQIIFLTSRKIWNRLPRIIRSKVSLLRHYIFRKLE